MKKFLVLLLVVLVPAFALAVPKGEKLEFKATQSHSANVKIIEKGIEGAVADMSFITRPIARKRLENSNTAFKTISVQIKGSKVYIWNDGRKPVVSPADGSKAQWTREDGETFTVSQKVSDTKIVQTFHADDGKKTLTYDFNDDFSQLTLNVVVESPKLAAPLKYTMKYAKK